MKNQLLQIPSVSVSWLSLRCIGNYIINEHIQCVYGFKWRAKGANVESTEKWKRDSLFIDKRGKLRNFNHKRVSRKKGGSLRGQGWKYGSGFVDGIFPVLSPIAQEILNFVQKEMDVNRIWSSLDNLPPTNTTWDDLIIIAVRLRLNKMWDPIVVRLMDISYISRRPKLLTSNFKKFDASLLRTRMRSS